MHEIKHNVVVASIAGVCQIVSLGKYNLNCTFLSPSFLHLVEKINRNYKYIKMNPCC